MLNSRLLLLFIACITVLSVSLMLFNEENKTPFVVSEQLVLDSEPLQPVIDQDLTQRPTNEVMPPSFGFANDIIEANEAELHRQKKKQQVLLQKSMRQAEQLEQLIAENNALQTQLRERDEIIEQQGADLAAVQIKNQVLQDSLSESENTQAVDSALVSKNQQMKDMIDRQPNVVKQASKVTTPSSNKVNLKEEAIYNPLSGAVEFGYSYDQDNNVNRALEARIVVDYAEPEQYKIHNDLYVEFEDEDSKTNTSKQRWQLQGDYNLAPEDFIFLRSDMQRSRFASYERQDVYAMGYGRNILKSKKQMLNVEVGPGYRIANPNEGKDAINIDETILRAYFFYSFVFSDALQFSSEGSVEAGQSNTTYSSILKMQNRIYQELYLVFDFDYKYTTVVPADTVNREVSSGLNLLYAF